MRKRFVIPALAAALTWLAAPPAHADYSNTVMSLGPVGYWPLNETTAPPGAATATAPNSGTLGALEDATFQGENVYGYPGAIAGSSDSAVSFSGFRNAAGMVPPSPDVSTAPSFTIEAWLLSHDDGTYWGTTCVLSDFDPTSPRSGWLIYANISNPGQYEFRAYAQNGTATSLTMDLGGAHSIQLEKWYHVVVVVSNAVTVTNVYGYVNGALVAGPVPLPAYVPNDMAAGGFTIGSRTDVASGYTMAGAADEVAYYTNALDPATILAHYQAGTNPAPTTAYSTLVLQSHPALYYHLNVSPTGQPYPVALPVAANHGSLGAIANGYYEPNTVPGVAGPTNAGFGPISLACNFPGVQPNVDQAVMCDAFNQTALNLTPGLTLTAWIRVPNFPLNFQTAIGRGDTSYRLDVDPTGFPHFACNPNGDVVGPTAIADGAWHFWAGVFDPVSNQEQLYIDGVLAAETSGGAPQNLSTYFLIGGDPEYTDRYFSGDICHVALFDKALSATQIGSLYSSVGVAPVIMLPTNAITANEGANASLTAGVVGTAPLTLQWYSIDTLGVTNPVAGDTTNTLTLNNVAASQNGYQYFLTAVNSYASVTSSIVTLTVVQGPPTIQVNPAPASQQVPVGVTVGYSVVAAGTLPFHYQWSQDGSPITGATTSALSLTALNGSHTYTVTVTNNFGPATSTPVTLQGVTTPPPVVTFNTTGTGWTINQTGITDAGVTNGTLLLTDGANGEASSAFFNTPQYNAGFAAFFTYQEADGSAPLADGATFCVQNAAAGPAALGGGGGELGFTGIENSSAFELNIYNGAHGGIGVQFGTNGMTADSPVATLPYYSTAPVNLASGHPINVQVYFNQGTYYVHLLDTVTSDSFLTTYNQGDMRGVVGADTAYVGFTGATGGLNSIQTISNFRFSYSTPPTLSVTTTGGNAVVSWPVSVATFFQLQKSDNVTGPWTSAGSPTVVGLQNQVSVPATGTSQFFRLQLQ
jgi:Concanavalin A-like lectin/glucanases superfamily/Bacterial lectin